MTEELEHRIRERAHSIWEQEGRPAGRADTHWEMASAELVTRTAKATSRRTAAASAAAPSVAKEAAAPAAAKRRKTAAKLA